MERLQLNAPDGRVLAVELDGPEQGQVVLLHTGTPSAGAAFSTIVEEGAQRGLRHLLYSRPGYAESTRAPGRTVADCHEDVAAIADALGIERFFTIGWSGGGPHALACAALLPERTIAAATLASVAPYDAGGLNWLAGMGESNVVEFAAAEGGEAELRAFLTEAREQILATDIEDLHAVLGDLLSDVDRSALTGALADYLDAATKRGLAHGIDGWLDDDLAFLSGWGFELAAVKAPVTIWQGSEDRFVPFAHGRWLAENVAGARARLLQGEGHLSIAIGSYGAVLDDLLSQAG
jgi:pimeloyl-ACP methyl ester carboxylesterase